MVGFNAKLKVNEVKISSWFAVDLGVVERECTSVHDRTNSPKGAVKQEERLLH